MTKLSKEITTTELMNIDYRYSYSSSELLKDWQRLQTITEYKTGAQFKPGMKLCQHFFPNFWDIEDKNGKSFASCWNDFEVMDKVRLWGLSSMSQLWLSWIRRAVYMAGGLPNSSFYRPHFSKQIIEMTGITKGTLYDPCAGWGGRMLGTVASGWNYHACEPNVETYNNLLRLIDFLGVQEKVALSNTVAEKNVLTQEYDVVLTSPPYFNLEVYTQTSDQSYADHSTFCEWDSQWLKPLIRECLSFLNPKGISAWNVMNFGKNNLVESVVSTHEEAGWILKSTVGFSSPLANIRTLKNKDVTYLFQKS